MYFFCETCYNSVKGGVNFYRESEWAIREKSYFRVFCISGRQSERRGRFQSGYCRKINFFALLESCVLNFQKRMKYFVDKRAPIVAPNP